MKGNFIKARLLYTWVPMLAGISLLTVLAWCALASTGPMDCLAILGDDGEWTCPDTRNLFQHLHWLWYVLLLLPGIGIGAMGVRAYLRCIVAYGVAFPLGMMIAAFKQLWIEPIFGPDFLLEQLGLSLLYGVVCGAVMVGVGALGRLIVRWAKKKISQGVPA